MNNKTNFIQIKINNIECAIPQDYTILQACEHIGIEIPRFCYHRELLIAGNCRMCLVELEKSPKPVASCAMQIMPGMNIYTDTPLVRKAREGVLEFLLLNHPLDCPICDQGGECDLQDQSILYGSDRSRFYEFKRSVEDKNCGPLIKTIMTRCIHCTRCVRFIDEVGGVPVLGTTNRGNHTEIGTYVNLNIKSELSGNLIDLCPVGALTSKPYAFRARSWELKNKSTLDLFDSLGANTISNTRGTKIMRIIPGINSEVNREWISDKARFSFDAFDIQRLNNPLIKTNGKFKEESNWQAVFSNIKSKIGAISPENFVGVSGQFVNSETNYIFKKLFNSCGILDLIPEKTNLNYNTDFVKNHIFNDSLTNFNDHDLCFIIGSNLRHESPVLNSQLRRRYLQGNFDIYSLGANFEKNVSTFNVGLNLKDLIDIVKGQHEFSKKLAQAKNPLIIVSSNIYNNKESKEIFELIQILGQKIKLTHKGWNSLNILQKNANDMNLIELGFKSINSVNVENKEVVVLLGTENFIKNNNINCNNKFIIYIGHHGTSDAQNSSIILPSYSFIEESGTYINTEGRAQISEKLTKYELNHRSMWSIIQMLCLVYNPKLTNTIFNSLNELRSDFKFNYPLSLNKSKQFLIENKSNSSETLITLDETKSIKPFTTHIENFYLNDLITKNSPIMSKTSTLLRSKKNFT